MRKNAQKVEWKTRSKISCHYTWLLHAKHCPSQWRFLRSLLHAKNWRSKIEGRWLQQKEEKRRKRKNEKKENKERSLYCPKTQNFDFCACPSHNALKRDAGDKASCCVANAFSTRLKVIGTRSSLKITKICPKNALFAKSSRSQWVNHVTPFSKRWVLLW